MRVLTIVHDADAGPGVFRDVLAAGGAETELWLPAGGAPAPRPAAAYDAIMSFGGAAHPHQEERHPWLVAEKRFLTDAMARTVPLLGICLGAELIAEAAGARSRHLSQPEIGWYEVALTEAGRCDPVFGTLGPTFDALEWHSYAVDPPAGATELARSSSCLQAYRLGERTWGLQFHAEVTAEDYRHWLDNYTLDEDAVRVGIDPGALAQQAAGRMAGWHDLGAGICSRFLQAAGS